MRCCWLELEMQWYASSSDDEALNADVTAVPAHPRLDVERGRVLLQAAQQAVVASQRGVHARVLAGEADLVAAARAAGNHRIVLIIAEERCSNHQLQTKSRNRGFQKEDSTTKLLSIPTCLLIFQFCSPAGVHRVGRRQRRTHAGERGGIDGPVRVRVLRRPVPLRRRVAGPAALEGGRHRFVGNPVRSDSRAAAAPGEEHCGLLLLVELRQLVLRHRAAGGVGSAVAVEDARPRPPVVHLL